MKIHLTGAIVDSEPRLPGRIVGKRLILDGRGRDRMVLDSGFTGSIAISEQWANRLDLRYAGIQPFELANGQIVSFGTPKVRCATNGFGYWSEIRSDKLAER